MPIFQRPHGKNVEDASGINTDNIEWENERHVACVMLLDTSASMSANDAIGKLNAGLKTFKNQVMTDKTFDERTKACIDIAIVTFGGSVKLVQDFIAVSNWNPTKLSAGGGTPLGEGINLSLDLIAKQKLRYNALGTPYFRPWVFCITDGAPTDDCTTVAQRLNQEEDAKKVLGYCVGVDGYDKQKMCKIFNSKRIFELSGLNFIALFEFVSSSLTQIRNSGDGSANVAAPKDVHVISMGG